MRLPFTPHDFFDIFVQYNNAVWPAQVLLYALGIVAIAAALSERARYRQVASAILAFLWLWMALAYHLAFFRTINPAASFFAAVFVAQAMLLLWHGVLRPTILYRKRSDVYGVASGALIAYALVGYPILNYFSGHAYPKMPTFGLPCPTTIFTFALLVLALPSLPRVTLVIPILWALVGTAAAVQLGVREDFGLAAAAAVSTILALRPRWPQTRRFEEENG